MEINTRNLIGFINLWNILDKHWMYSILLLHDNDVLDDDAGDDDDDDDDDEDSELEDRIDLVKSKEVNGCRNFDSI